MFLSGTLSILFTGIYEEEFSPWFAALDDELHQFNKLSSNLAWTMSTEKTNDSLIDIGVKVGVIKTIWKNVACNNNIQAYKESEKRMMYLLCRGPKYSGNEAM